MKNIFLFLSITLLVCACSKQDETDESLILDYIAENNLDAQVTSEGLYYVIENPGNDEKPNINSNVDVNYKGYLLDGTVFDENDDISFNLWGVIEGWQIGIPLFGKGGNGVLLVPSRLGYGSSGVGSIPGNSVLIFEITLNDFQ